MKILSVNPPEFRSVIQMLVCPAVLLVFLSPAPLPAADSGKPNIVLIFADDLGWQDTGFSGSDFAETPNLDRLASEGMIFPNAYAAAGNCQPSRACLMSGHYTPGHDVYAVGSTSRGPKNLLRMIPIPNRSSLPVDTVTMGEALKAAEYATGLFGKQHLKRSKAGKAEEAGFDTVKVSQHSKNSNDPADPKGIFPSRRLPASLSRPIEADRFSLTSHITQFIRGSNPGLPL